MSYSSEVLADTPYLYWRLGESSGTTAADGSGNARTGTYHASGVTYAVAGPLVGDADTSVTFDGTAGEVHSSAALNLSAIGVVTVEFWIKASAYNTSKMILEFTPDLNSNIGAFWCYEDAAAGLHLAMRGPTNSRYGTFPYPSTGVWHHVALVYNKAADIHKAYVDGVAQTITRTGAATSGNFVNNTLYVASRGGTIIPCAASMDEFALYTSELSATRIQRHYRVGAGYNDYIKTGIGIARVFGTGAWKGTYDKSGRSIAGTKGAGVKTLHSKSGWASVNLRYSELLLEDSTELLSEDDRIINTEGGGGYGASDFTGTFIKAGWATAGATSRASKEFRLGYSTIVLADAPYLYWRLGEASAAGGMVDSSGNSRGGDYSATGVTYSVPGAVVDPNTGVTLNGTSGSAISNVQLNLNAYGKATVEFWIKANSWDDSGDVAFDFGYPSSDQGSFGSVPNSSTFPGLWEIGVRKGTIRTATFPRPSTGVWHHIVHVFDVAGGISKTYVDSVPQSLSLGGSSGVGTLANVYLTLGYRVGNINYIAASIDEFALYTSELSAARVRAHYFAGLGFIPETGYGKAGSIGAGTSESITVKSGYSIAGNTATGTSELAYTKYGFAKTNAISAGATEVIYNRVGRATANVVASGSKQIYRPYANEVLADSPYLYWRFGESSGLTAVDSSGNARNGVYHASGVTLGTTGAILDTDDAVTLNGITGEVHSAAGLTLSAFSVLTLEVWANAQSNAGLICEYSPNANSYAGGFWLYSSGTVTQVFMRSAGSTRSATFPSPPTNTWNHYVCVYNLSTNSFKVYVDGILQTLTYGGGTVSGTFGNYNLNVGSRDAGAIAGFFYPGAVDELAIYTYELPATRVAAHYKYAAYKYGYAKIGGTARGIIETSRNNVNGRARAGLIAKGTSASIFARSGWATGNIRFGDLLFEDGGRILREDVYALDTEGGGGYGTQIFLSFIVEAGSASVGCVASGTSESIFIRSGQAAVGINGSGNQATDHTRSGYATIGATTTGAEAEVCSESGYATTSGVAAGSSESTYAKTGRAVIGDVSTGIRAKELVRANYTTVGTVGSGAGASIFVRSSTGLIGTTSTATSASITSKAGFGGIGSVGAGIAFKAGVYVKTGFAAVLAGIGAGDLIFILNKAGPGEISIIGSGRSASIFVRTSSAIVGTTAAGAGTIAFVKTGYATAGGIATASSASTVPDAGHGVIGGIGVGSRSIFKTKTGYATIAGKATGPRFSIHTKTGFSTVGGIGRGTAPIHFVTIGANLATTYNIRSTTANIYPVTTALDNADRANENPLSFGGKWAGPIWESDTLLKVESSQIAPQINGILGSAYWTQQFDRDQEIFFRATTNGLNGAIALRQNYPGAVGQVQTGYDCWFSGGLAQFEYNNGDGTYVDLGTGSISFSVAAGDIIGARVVGNVLTLYKNGHIALQVTDPDNKYPETGYIGMEVDQPVDDVGGGSVPFVIDSRYNVAAIINNYLEVVYQVSPRVASDLTPVWDIAGATHKDLTCVYSLVLYEPPPAYGYIVLRRRAVGIVYKRSRAYGRITTRRIPVKELVG
jgi:hypothetical protein